MSVMLQLYHFIFPSKLELSNLMFLKRLSRQLILICGTAISCIIFWDFPMFYQIFLSPQVKRWAIITYKHGIYQLPHKLPNDLRKLGNIRKVSKLHRIYITYYNIIYIYTPYIHVSYTHYIYVYIYIYIHIYSTWLGTNIPYLYGIYFICTLFILHIYLYIHNQKALIFYFYYLFL